MVVLVLANGCSVATDFAIVAVRRWIGEPALAASTGARAHTPRGRLRSSSRSRNGSFSRATAPARTGMQQAGVVDVAEARIARRAFALGGLAPASLTAPLTGMMPCLSPIALDELRRVVESTRHHRPPVQGHLTTWRRDRRKDQLLSGAPALVLRYLATESGQGKGLSARLRMFGCP